VKDNRRIVQRVEVQEKWTTMNDNDQEGTLGFLLLVVVVVACLGLILLAGGAR
jgi:hypothetical protein